jgi:hypothetical protein
MSDTIYPDMAMNAEGFPNYSYIQQMYFNIQ